MRNKNALQAASERGFTLKLSNFFVEKGADINANGGLWRQCPPSRLPEGGHLDIVQFLVEKGADIAANGRYDGNVLEAAEA